MSRRPNGRSPVHTLPLPEKVHGALAEARRLVRSLDGIAGVDYGVAYRNGKPTGRHAVRFHVSRKRPLNEIKPHRRAPRSIGSLPVDVVATGYRLHATGPRGFNDVMRPGISVGNLRSKATGTLGALVIDNETNTRCILSNWHVLCGDVGAAAGEQICQPGPMDLGSDAARQVGELLRWCRLSEQIDAALARLAPGADTDTALFGIDLRPTGTAAPVVGMKLVKSGAVTGVTHAMIDGVGGRFQMDYAQFGDGPRWIEGFRLVPDPDLPTNALCLEGDSGSLWIEASTGRAVGLHFAGEDDISPANDYALAQPIENVLARLNATLAPSANA